MFKYVKLPVGFCSVIDSILECNSCVQIFSSVSGIVCFEQLCSVFTLPTVIDNNDNDDNDDNDDADLG